MRSALVLVLIAAAFGCLAPAATAAPKGQRDVVVVSNNWAGTADLVDPRSFERLARINVVPDRAERIAQIEADPAAKPLYDFIREVIGEGHNQYVDDGFTSKDGRYVYFSRPSFADVVALDVKTEKIAWRVKVDGYRADHMALSPDGRRLLVSASTARNVNVIDTARGRIVGRIPSGDQPHENNFSRDGKLIYHASIGPVYSDTDDPSEDATKGERVFEIIDARTLKVKRRIDMGKKVAEFGRTGMSSAVRPMALSPDERFVYFQLSFFHGFVEYDLKQDRVRRLAFLPLSARAKKLSRRDYLLDSAHHGLTINNAGTKFCVAGTMSNYAAIVSRRTLRPQRIIPVGRVPYWSTTTRDGRYCFVSVAGDDRVSVISWKTAREVASIKVGDHPQRMRAGTIRRALLRR
ncbi:MAG: serine/threonine protein kinase [Thermoleophilaceae bacterium]|nr:serine/threonine protein kinase [Thermoleophilaceae bacterium]